MFSFICNIIKTFNPAQKNWQLSLAVCFGMVAGLTPLANIFNLVVLLVALTLNINTAALALSFTAFFALGALLSPCFDWLGSVLLQSSSMQALWTWYYNLPYMQLTNFNHTLTMGSLVASFVAAVPLFLLVQVTFPKYQSIMRKLPLQLLPKEGEKVRFLQFGRIVCVLVFVGVVGGGAYLYLDPLVEQAVEQRGSEVLQVQLSMGSLTTSIAACRVALTKLELANATNVMENIIEIDNIRLRVDPTRLAQKKIVVEEITLDGIRFQQPRRTPAKSYRAVQTEQPATQAATPAQSLEKYFNFSFTSPEDILKNENLKSVQALKDAQKETEAIKAKWQQRAKSDLGKDKIAGYKKQITELETRTKTRNPLAIPKIVEDAKALMQAINSDLKNVSTYKRELEADKAKIESLCSEIEKAREQDVEMLKSKYVPSVDNLNLVESLLTPEGKTKLRQGLHYYKLVQPYLARHGDQPAQNEPKPVVQPVPGVAPKPAPQAAPQTARRGNYILFQENDPMPDFVVKKGDLSLSWQEQKLSGKLLDWSNDPALYARPARLSLTGANTPLFASLAIDFLVDRTTECKDTLEIKVSDYKLPDMRLGDVIELKQGLVNVAGDIYVKNGSDLSGQVRLEFPQASLNFVGQQQNELTKTIAQALAAVKSFYIQITVSGQLDNFGLSVQSDLDKVIAEQVQNLVQNKAKELASGLTMSVNSATAEVGNVKNFGGNLNKLNTNISGQETELKSMLEKIGKEFNSDKLRQGVPKVPGLPW
jgi:uncharacterized protein (TIGR03545 family)/uncharacterized protein (TIGR03546 family)